MTLLILILLVVTAGSGCASYDDYYIYLPRPAVVELAPGDGPEVRATTLVTVLSVRPPGWRDEPTGVDLRLLFENTGAASLRFDPASLSLLSGDLESFGPPSVTPAQPIEISPGDARTVDATVPFPADEEMGALDLAGLRARWEVESGERSFPQSGTFTRRAIRYDHYYYPPHYDHGGHGIHFGVSHYRRW